MTIRRIFTVMAIGMAVWGLGFMAWAGVFYVQSQAGIAALKHQADVNTETSRAMVRLTERMDTQGQAMLILRDRIVRLEDDVRRLETHNGGADARGSDADAD